MNTTLMFGVLLIVAGIAFAILAYALILNRRGEAGPKPDAVEPESGATPTDVDRVPAEPVLGKEVGTASQAPPGQSVAEPVVPAPALPTPPARVIPAAPGAARQSFEVARLMRDEVTGSLIIGIGTRAYRSVEELKGSADWPRIEAAARDLQSWFTAAPRPKPVEERRADEPAGRSGSMLDQINDILERRLTQSPDLPQGVRLVPSPEGGVRVMIGLQTHPLDQVPDERVNRIIRESVSEWEQLS